MADWAAGFIDAVAVRATAWAPILEGEESRALMLPLLVLGSDDERRLFDAAPVPEDELEKLLADGADITTEAIPAI